MQKTLRVGYMTDSCGTRFRFKVITDQLCNKHSILGYQPEVLVFKDGEFFNRKPLHFYRSFPIVWESQ